MDIKPPKNWKRPKAPDAMPPVSVTPGIPPRATKIPQPDLVTPPSDDALLKPQRKRRRALAIVLMTLGVLLAATAGAFGWYTYSLQPRNPNAGLQLVTVESGMTPRSIAGLLEEKQIIRSRVAFEVYANLSGYANSLQAGSYRLGASQSVADIVDHLRKGINDVYNVTVLPGLTLKQLADPEVRGSLAAQGFTSEEIAAALTADYSSPVLADRPSGTSLEGYIFPETYQLRTGDGLTSLIQRSLDELYSRLQAGGLIKKFASRGLDIHQAITLASIVQKEVSDPEDQRQVAQVFLKRLDEGMVLGSDVTFIYAAEQLEVTPSVDIDSPYNTRKHAGLPPGPIANMNFSALEAVADPADGDYLYFVAGDDGKTYFSKTYEEHQTAVTAHCKVLCSQY